MPILLFFIGNRHALLETDILYWKPTCSIGNQHALLETDMLYWSMEKRHVRGLHGSLEIDLGFNETRILELPFWCACRHSATIIDYIHSIQIPHYLSSLMLRFVYVNIKLYNVPESRVHLTETSPITIFRQKVHYILWTFWGSHVQPGVLGL